MNDGTFLAPGPDALFDAKAIRGVYAIAESAHFAVAARSEPFAES
jgi:hypothetical protein